MGGQIVPPAPTGGSTAVGAEALAREAGLFVRRRTRLAVALTDIMSILREVRSKINKQCPFHGLNQIAKNDRTIYLTATSSISRRPLCHTAKSINMMLYAIAQLIASDTMQCKTAASTNFIKGQHRSSSLRRRSTCVPCLKRLRRQSSWISHLKPRCCCVASAPSTSIRSLSQTAGSRLTQGMSSLLCPLCLRWRTGCELTQ